MSAASASLARPEHEAPMMRVSPLLTPPPELALDGVPVLADPVPNNALARARPGGAADDGGAVLLPHRVRHVEVQRAFDDSRVFGRAHRAEHQGLLQGRVRVFVKLLEKLKLRHAALAQRAREHRALQIRGDRFDVAGDVFVEPLSRLGDGARVFKRERARHRELTQKLRLVRGGVRA
jgi:hypothetical protein